MAPLRVLPQTGDELVRQIAYLDKSQESYPTLFREVLQLLDLPSDTCDLPPTSKDLAREQRRGFSPLDEWSLKWLLKRLGSEGPARDCATMSYQSWCLMLKLIARLRLKTIARILAEFKLSVILERTTERLSQLAQEWEQLHLRPELEDPIASAAKWQDVFSIFSASVYRKRKRGDANGSPPSAKEIALRCLSHLTSSITELLKHIQLRTSRGSDDSEAFAKEQLRSSLRMDSADAAQMLGHFFSSARIIKPQRGSRGESGDHEYPAMLEPFIALWEARLNLSDNQTGLLDSRNFCERCLVPALTLLCLPKLLRDKDSNALKSLILTYCIAPSHRKFSPRDKAPGSDDGIIHALLDEAVESLTAAGTSPEPADARSQLPNGAERTFNATLAFDNRQAAASSTSRQSHTRQLNPTSFLYELALDYEAGASRKPSSLRVSWLSQLFVDLAKSLQIDFQQPFPLPADDRLEIVSTLLRLSLESHSLLDRSILEVVCLEFCLFSDETQSRAEGWARLRYCIELDPSIVTGAPALGKSADQGTISPVLELILHSYTNDAGTTKTLVRHSAQDALIVTADAFANAREAPRFIQLWQQQLAKEFRSICRAEKEGLGRSLSRAWSNESLCRYLAPKLLSSLNHSQVGQSLKELDRLVLQDSSAERDFPELWTSLIVVFCLLSMDVDERLSEALLEPAKSFYLHALGILSSKIPDLLRVGLWQVLALISERWPEVLGDEASKNATKMLLSLPEQLVMAVFEGQEPVGPLGYEAFVASWIYVTTIANLQAGHHTPRATDASALVDFAVRRALINLDKHRDLFFEDPPLEVSGLHGSEDALNLINSKGQFLLVFLAVTSARMPCMAIVASPWSQCLQSVSTLAAIEFHRSGRGQFPSTPDAIQSRVSWLQLWHALLIAAAAGESGQFSYLMKEFHLENLADTIGFQRDQKADLLECAEWVEFLIHSLKVSKVNNVSGHERQQLADTLWDEILAGKLRPDFCATAMELLLQFISLPRKAMKIFRDPASLEALAKVIDQLTSQELEMFLPLLKRLAKHLSEFATSSMASGGQNSYLENFKQSLRNAAQIQELRRPSVAAFVMGATTLHHLRQTVEAGELEDIRKAYLHGLIRILTVIEVKGDRVDPRLLPVLDAIITFPDLLPSLPSAIVVPYGSAVHASGKPPLVSDEFVDVAGLLSDLESDLELKLASAKALEIPTDNGVGRVLAAIRRTKRQAFEEHVSSLARAEVGRLSILGTLEGSAQQVVFAVKDFQMLDATSKAHYLRKLVSSQKHKYARYNLLMLLRAILGSPLPFDSRNDDLRAALGQVLNDVLAAATMPNKIESPYMAFRALDSLVRNHAWAVAQWHIDSLLSAISIKTSPSAPSSAGEDPRCTFAGLCQLFQSILSAHRSRISGRYHLVVDALNGLLRCLFCPYTGGAGDTGMEQPPWLYPPGSSRSSNPLDEAHAKAFARVVGTICDPAPGAVKPPRGNRDIPRHERHLLTDGVKKARAISGQHLQYVMTEFCTLQLRGRLAPAVRAALNPGLYAMFRAMSVEVQRTANAALDEQGRAIFKAAYDDYMKFGRWEKT